jgi:putative transposase
MARRPRLYLPDCPLHIIQRGNNRDACFRDDSDYKAYLHFMREAAVQYAKGAISRRLSIQIII